VVVADLHRCDHRAGRVAAAVQITATNYPLSSRSWSAFTIAALMANGRASIEAFCATA
jgi:hypothetical protein